VFSSADPPMHLDKKLILDSHTDITQAYFSTQAPLSESKAEELGPFLAAC
jgi:hypothetical protein